MVSCSPALSSLHTGVGCTPVSSCAFFPCRVHVVPTAPEFPVPVLVFQFRILFVNHQAAFPFEVPHETRYCYLWRYLYEHMHMIRTYLCFDNLDPSSSYTASSEFLPTSLRFSLRRILFFGTLAQRRYDICNSNVVCVKLFMSFIFE